MEKITQEELEKLREFNNRFATLRGKIVDIEMSMRKLNKDKSLTFDIIDELYLESKDLEKNLTEKYGNISINLETGEIKE